MSNLYVDTATNGANSVTKINKDVFNDLLEALKKGFTWKPVKGGPKQRYHDLQKHLNEEHDEIKIQETIFGTIHKRTERFPFHSRMLLFGISAMLSGLPSSYHSNVSELIASAWGGIGRKTLRDLHRKTLTEFFVSYCQPGISDDPAVQLLLEILLESLTWRPVAAGPTEKPHVLKTHLETNYVEFKLQQKLLGKIQKPKDFSAETVLFLFGLCAMFSGLPTNDSFNYYELVSDAFGGVGRVSLKKVCEDTAIAVFSRLLRADDSNLSHQEAVPALISPADSELNDSWNIRAEDESIYDINPPTLDDDCSILSITPALISPGPASIGGNSVVPDSELEMPPATVPPNKIKATLKITSLKPNQARSDLIIDNTEQERTASQEVDFWLLPEKLEEYASEDGPISLNLQFTGPVESARLIVENWAYQTLKKEKDKNGFSTIRSKNKGESKIQKEHTYVRMIDAAKNMSEVEQQTIRRKAHLLLNINTYLCDGNANEDALLEQAIKQFGGLELMRSADFKYSMEEVEYLRSRLHCSANLLVKLDQFDRHVKGNSRFPSQLKKKMKKFEDEYSLPIKSTLLELVVDSNGSTQHCLYWHVKNTVELIQRQMESAIRSGDFEDSLTFSYRKNKGVYVFGCDKDTDGTSVICRLANRKGGNSKEHTQVLAYVETAEEKNCNLVESLFEEGSPVVSLLQLLLDDKLFGFTFVVKDFNNVQLQSNCKLLNLFEYDGDKQLPHVDINCVRRADNMSGKQALQNISIELDPFKCFNLEFISGITFSFQMVFEEDDDLSDDKCVGYCLYKNADVYPFYATTFKTPLLVPLGGRLEVKALQIEGYVSCDKKNSWAVQGMGESASAYCNCIVCIQPRDSYIKNPPDWMSAWRPLNPHFQKVNTMDTDAPLREGNYCSLKLHQTWKKKTGDHAFHLTENELKHLKRNVVFSVTKKPALRIPPNKQTTGIMHGPHGVHNHFKKNLLADIRKIDETDSEWIQSIEAVLDDLRNYTIQGDTFKKLQRANRKIANEINSIRKEMEEAGPDVHSITIDEWILDIEELEKERLDDAVESGLADQVKLMKGAKLLDKSLKTYQLSGSKKPRGEAEYALYKAIESLGGVFNAEHGGFELNHGEGIDMLEHWDAIVEIVSGTYTGDTGKKQQIVKIMEGSQKIAKPLFWICLQLKSQKKWERKDIEVYRNDICELYSAWRDTYPGKDVFPKLHDLCRHVVDFIAERGMYGRLSEESFESTHQKIKAESANLKKLCDTRLRAQCLSRRIQVSIHKGVESVRTAFSASIKGKKRGPYKRKGKRNKNTNSIDVDSKKRDANGGIVYINSETAIKEEWIEAWDMAVKGRVPDSWHRVFEELEDLGRVKKEQAKFVSQK